MKTTLMAIFFTICIVSLTSCTKDENDSTTPDSPKVFSGLTFNKTNAYFSTDGSMTAPVNETQAKTMTSKIDITFFFHQGETKPGFFDPVARSQQWYWNEFYQPWLSTAVETRFYTTTLTSADYEAAKTDPGKIATYFSNASTVLAPHGVFPVGSCIGGREGSESTTLAIGQVYGFKNTASGKRGLMNFGPVQSYGWPLPILDFNTNVDIIREN